MCLKRFNWRQNTLSILLLIIVLASHSSQHKLLNAPQQPFNRFSKAVGGDTDGFIPIVAPTDYRPNAIATAAPVIQTNENPVTQSSATTMAPADRRIDYQEDFNNESEDEKEQVRSINVSLQELEEVVWDFLAVAGQANEGSIQKRSIDDQRALITDLLFNDNVINTVKKFAEKYIFQAASGSALQNFMPAGGRLFLFKGITN